VNDAADAGSEGLPAQIQSGAPPETQKRLIPFWNEAFL
jgi:hypothetical protein